MTLKTKKINKTKEGDETEREGEGGSEREGETQVFVCSSPQVTVTDCGDGQREGLRGQLQKERRQRVREVRCARKMQGAGYERWDAGGMEPDNGISSSAEKKSTAAGVLRSLPHVVSANDPIRSVFLSPCSKGHRRVGPVSVFTTLPKDFLSWPWLRLSVRACTHHPPTRPPPHWNRSHGHANEQDLREQMKECYRVEGVNHLENCKHIVSAYLESLQVRAW